MLVIFMICKIFKCIFHDTDSITLGIKHKNDKPLSLMYRVHYEHELEERKIGDRSVKMHLPIIVQLTQITKELGLDKHWENKWQLS